MKAPTPCADGCREFDFFVRWVGGWVCVRCVYALPRRTTRKFASWCETRAGENRLCGRRHRFDAMALGARRKWQGKKGGGQWTRGKSFDTFLPLGPVLVSPSEIKDPQNLRSACPYVCPQKSVLDTDFALNTAF